MGGISVRDTTHSRFRDLARVKGMSQSGMFDFLVSGYIACLRAGHDPFTEACLDSAAADRLGLAEQPKPVADVQPKPKPKPKPMTIAQADEAFWQQEALERERVARGEASVEDMLAAVRRKLGGPD
ncbi:MAG: hypothetical protein DDT36_01277 [Firmicutes bacterium]|nr:hypothetical protein [Bacillota bacterium]